jgi:hypothetical protein
MANEIVIQVKLGSDEIGRAGQEISRKLNNALNAGRSTALQQERAHALRIAQIYAEQAAKIEVIERRKQAQIDLIRERAVQREIEQQRKIERAAQSGAGGFQAFLRRYSSTIREAGESIQQAGLATLALTGAIVGLGRSAFQSALQIDQQVNVLKALTGSAEAAEKRFAKLVATAQKTPGLTTGLALTLDTQLRTLSVSEQTINRVLPAIGRLNAVSPLGDPQKFAQNLVQLVTQNFERQDLKELVGQSPLAGDLIRQIFNVNSPTNAKAIRAAAKELGITTVEGFFDEFARAAAENPKLRNITESLATQFEKLRDRVIVALRPLGLTIVQTLQPIVEKLVPVIERISTAFANLPEGVRQLIVILGALAAALGPVLIAIGAAIQTFGALGNVITAVAGAGGVAALIEAFGPFIPVVLAVAAAIGALVTAFVVDFGGIRTVVFDVLAFISTQFAFVKQAFVDNRAEIELLKIEFAAFSEEVKPIVKAFGEAFKNVFEFSIKGAIIVAKAALEFFNDQLAITVATFKTIKTLLVEIANAGAKAADFLTPGLNLGTAAKNRFNSATQARAGTLAAQGLNNENDPGQALNALVDDLKRLGELNQQGKRKSGAGGAGGDTKASAARALRDAQLAFTKEQAENELKLVKDANDRGLRELKENYDQRRITVTDYYRNKQILSVDTLEKELASLKQEEAAIRKTLETAKGSERLRDEAKLNDVLTEEEIKRRAILDVINETTDAFFNETKLATASATEQIKLAEKATSVYQQFAAAINKATGESQALIQKRFELREIIQQEGTQLKKNIDQLKAQVALGGENFGLKAEQARLEAILEVRQADEEAILSMIKNRERLADASILHADRANAIFLDHLARQQSVTEATADAMIKAYEGVAGSIDKGIDKLTKKLGFFGDVINGIIKSIVRNLLANVFAPTFGGGAVGGGGGGGGVLGSIVGGIFGQGAGGGLLSNIFRTPPTFPTSIATVGSLANASAGIKEFFGSSVPLTAGVINPTFGNFFSGLGKSFGAAAPLLGLSLGVAAGGKSIGGQILGGIGGTLGGLVAGTALAGGTLGGLGSTFALAGALGPAALIAAPLLIAGGILLGKAKQRKQDEEAAGAFQRQAHDQLAQLKAGIASDQIDGSQARAIFDNDILGVFRQQISTLKTKSVVESRLRNQTRDIEAVYQAIIVPEIAAQATRRANQASFAAIDRRLIPQFAGGGISGGGGLAILHPNEMVLTPTHQAMLRFIGGSDVFERIGVPGVQPEPVFDRGGIMSNSSFAPVIVVNLDAVVDAEGIFIKGGSGRNGERVIAGALESMRTRGKQI